MTHLFSSHATNFAQPDPPRVCRHWPTFLRMSASKGYACKCREARCSLTCYANWRQKEGAILRRFLVHHLPDEMTVYRGNLTMPPDTTAHDHSTAVSKFLRTVARRSKASGTTTRVLLTVHVTGPDAMHFDTITYSDASKAALRETIRDAWKSAGGKCYSIVDIDTEEEKVKAAKYTTKDTQRAERTSLLPSSSVTNLQRYHANFFAETSKDMLWAECIKAWFGVPVDDDSAPIVSNIDKGLYDTLDDTIRPISEAEFHLAEAKDKHDLREAALRLIAQLAPRSEDRALPLSRLSRTLSIPEGWLCNLLPSVCDVERTAGGNYWRRMDWHADATDSVPTGSRV